MTPAVTIKATPIRMPGMIPPANKPPIDIWSCPPMMMATVLGGMIAPITALEAVTAAENAGG